MPQGEGGDVDKRRYRMWEPINARFALVMAVALLPLGVISLVQTRTLQVAVQARDAEALMGATLGAAAQAAGKISLAQGLVAALSGAPAVLGDADGCLTLLRNAAAQLDFAVTLAYLPADGPIACQTIDAGLPTEDAGLPTYDAGLPTDLRLSHSVVGPDGQPAGRVELTLPLSVLALDLLMLQTETGPAPLQIWTFDGTGAVLTTNIPGDDGPALLPKARPLTGFIDQPQTVFAGVSKAGQPRSYAVAPVLSGAVYLMTSWDHGGPKALKSAELSRYLPPLTMWALGMIVAALASEWLVSRHVRLLTGSIKRFARGDRSMKKIDLSGAPVEISDAGEAFARMSDTILHSEAQLEDTIHQKEVLLREVHHRVKNNLQLIASIMNIQMRKAIAPEAKALLRGLHDRIMSLATIHRGLYQTSGLADVRADELFKDIVRQIVNIGSGLERRFELAMDVEDLHLTPDQAVPLSLLLTEAMTNAMKYAGSSDGKSTQIAVRLKRETGRAARMEVENSLPTGVHIPGFSQTPDAGTQSTGLGDQLLTAFAQQLGGTLERTLTEDSYLLSLRFNVNNLTEAEARSAAEAQVTAEALARDEAETTPQAAPPTDP